MSLLLLCRLSSEPYPILLPAPGSASAFSFTPSLHSPNLFVLFLLTSHTVGAGLTFKVFEWQAVAAARVLAGKAKLPGRAEQEKWEQDRIALKGDGPAFTVVNPDFKDYFEGLRLLAGEPGQGVPGRRLPVFDQRWKDDFDAGHERRKEMWRRSNRAAAGVL